MPTYPYPPAWPASEIADSIGAITAGKLLTAHEAHCAWAIAGYGLSVIAPDVPATVALKTKFLKAWSKANPDVVKLTAKTPKASGAYLKLALDGSTPLAAIDWATLLPILIKLILSFFGL
jgi:hypothetical protein